MSALPVRDMCRSSQHEVGRQPGIGGPGYLSGTPDADASPGMPESVPGGPRLSLHGPTDPTRRAAPEGTALVESVRRRPTLPPSRPGSTIGAGGLNFRVRDGTGCFPPLWPPKRCSPGSVRSGTIVESASPRAELGNCDSEREQSQVLGLLVPVGSTRCRAYTSGLSTSWSARGLTWLTQWEISSRGELRT